MSAFTATVSEEGSGRTPIRRIGLIVPLLIYIIGALIFFRWQIFSDFDLVFGDRGDARFVAFIHEHVFRWLSGQAEFLSPPFFFDQAKTLGYSDAFLLDQIIYYPLRLLGAEPLLALSLVAIILSPIAYFPLYMFLRRLDVSMGFASLAAVIFTFANNLYLMSIHLQHFAVYYIPVIAYCSLLAIGNVHQHPFRACAVGAFAAGVFGFLFSTGYYMAWFFGLGLLICTPIAAFTARPKVLAWWRAGPTRVLGLGLAAGLSFFAATSIFAVIYLPVLTLGAARTFSEYLIYAPTPIDLFNIGSDNLIWSGLIRSLHLIREDRLFSEASIALTPTVQVLLLASAAIALHPRFWPTTLGTVSRGLVIAGAVVYALLYLVTIKTHNISLFHLLYAIMPGANAIRAGYRGMVVANLFAAISIGLALDRIVLFVRQRWHGPRRVAAMCALAALLTMAALEQVNLVRPAQLSREVERAHMAKLATAPHECRTFYAAPQINRAPYEVQIDAMMVALAQHLPTINGYSGLVPPGWDFYNTNSADYEQRANRWAVKRGITEGLCRVDIYTGTWSAPDIALDRID